jgi:replicative DNA helicase
MMPETNTQVDAVDIADAGDTNIAEFAKPRPEGAISVDHLIDRIKKFGGGKKFGWKLLDDRGVEVTPGDLALVAGRTGHGKTTVLFNLLIHWLDAHPGETLVFFSYEIPPEAVLLKMLSALTRHYGNGGGWSYHEVRRWMQRGDGQAPEGLDVNDLRDALHTLQQWEERLIVIYRPDWNAEELCQHATHLSASVDKLGAVLVDYLQIVPPPPGEYDGRAVEVAIIARRLKRLAVKLDCPVVAAAQFSREAVQFGDWVPDGTLEDEKVLKAIAKRRPQLHHLNEGAGEQEADLVVGLLNYQADYLAACEDAGLTQLARQETGNAGLFEIAIIKNRHGELGLAPLILEARTGYIRETGAFGR